MIELPGKIRVLRFRAEEVRRLASEGEHVDRLYTKLDRDYPDWVVYKTLYRYDSDYVYVILTETLVPVLSTVVRDEETGRTYIKEEVLDSTLYSQSQ